MSFVTAQTPEEIRQIIWKYFAPIFQGYDADMNGTLERKELRLLLADGLGVKPHVITEQQLDYHFNRIDEDHNGVITYQEYFEHFFSERAHLVFKKYDKDNSKFLDRAEFGRLMEETFAVVGLKVTPEMLDWNFSKLDKDGDGKVDHAEYIALIKKYCSGC